MAEVRPGVVATAQLPAVRAEILLGGAGDQDAHAAAADLAAAEAILAPLVTLGVRAGVVGEAVASGALLAVARWRAGRRAEALAALSAALTLGYHRGYRWSFFRHGAEMRTMLADLCGGTYAGAAPGGAPEAAPEVAAEAAALLEAWPPGEASPRDATGVDLPPVPLHALLVDPLTCRQEEVLRLLARNLSNKEIAQLLHVSPLTVRNHTVQIYEKLGVSSRRAAVAQAATMGLL
jgi:LuxR family maltose regulon positive regulatory protein